MTTLELKTRIQKKLDKIKDPSLLEEVDSIINFITSEREDWNKLPEELKEAVEEGLAQLDSGKKLSYDEVKRRNSRWFST